MSANLNNLEQAFTDQLSEFDSKLREQDDNASLLKEIHVAITALMSQTDDRDVEIREILQKRYNGGKLRLETYQLVRNVLDRVVIESMATMPDAVDAPNDEATFGSASPMESSKRTTDELPQDHLKVGSVLRDRFLLQERVAGGSMGVVYKALDRRIAEADGIDPWVAIKVLSPRLSKNGHALRALQQEAAKGRCLSHPNIVRFMDLDRDDDIYFIVMEWLEGRSLASILDSNRNQELDLATALDIVRQVGLALDYAHRCGVVHADVKPANVMIEPSGQVKLFDFGIARIKQKQLHTRRDFDPGVLGAVTPAYSSMQVLTGEEPTPADDVFSLGCLMYRLVAGHRVFGPRNAAEAAEEGLEPQRPNNLADSHWRALKKALAYSRVSRFATPAEFLAALNEDDRPMFSAETLSAHEQPIVVEPKPRMPKARRPWGLAAILAVLFAGAIALVMLPDLRDRLWSAGQSVVARTGLPGGGPDDRAAANPFVEGPAVTPDEIATVDEDTDTASDQAGSAAGTPDESGDTTAVADETGAPATNARPGDTTTPVRRPETTVGTPLVGPTDEQSAAGEVQQDPAALNPAEQAASDVGPGEARAPGETAQPGTAAGAPGAVAQPSSDTALAAPATVTVPLGTPGSLRSEFELILRENQDPAVVELVRESDFREPLAVLVEEVAFSGNRSPLTTGRYRLSGHMARFEAGQRTARFTISMSSDTLREGDRQATLLVRNAANSSSRFALLNLTLEDDDRRAFESGLPPDTVGFSDSQLYVSERSPAVQIDVLRFNPGDGQLDVRYTISGGSATEGEDYFVPGATGLVFGPGQRSARLLIPLVQDALADGEESFTLELLTDAAPAQANVHRQITVTIGDDDTPF